MTTYETLTALCDLYLRPLSHWLAADGTTSLRGAPGLTPVFEPPLTAPEQATLADLTAMAKSRTTAEMTLAEYQTIKPFLDSEAAWMAITRNAFVAMTEADSRRALYDIITAEVRLARAQRRDG
jgi:hypothetical protein